MARKIRIIAVGRSHDKLLLPLINDYESRLNRTLQIVWHIMPPKTDSNQKRGVIIAAETNSITTNLKQTEYVILLDERGDQMTSENFSEKLELLYTSEKNICFVIGGAFGVSESLRQRADMVLSLSQMVLPHQLVRLFLIEQLYRSHSIASGGKYHHGPQS